MSQMDPARLKELLLAIEGKDASTAAHTWRVVLYARAMAEEAGVPEERLHEFTYAAALHDVGKLETPRAILTKPGRLTPLEFEIIKLHPVTGYARMITMGVENPTILDLIRYHHERWDGKGYPYAIAGEAIPKPARYFAVIDTFDAMTSRRPYRSAVGAEAADRAIEEIHRGRGSRYAPDAVDLFTNLYKRGCLDWIQNYCNDENTAAGFIDADAADQAYQRQRLPTHDERT
jgi:HD-GYP domain-containing protein (c-di-GMP phosphodiesterase class II)